MATLSYTITIETNDERPDATARVALNLSEMLYLAYGDNVQLFDAEGKHFVYDHYAHDGHHNGHEVALTVEP